MENKEQLNLTAAEVSSLWEIYQYETLAICGIKHFLNHVDDKQIRQILERGLQLSNKRIDTIITFLRNEKCSVPQGFTEQDVNLEAPRLFSDKLYLEYIIKTTKLEISMYGFALMNAARKDIIDFYKECLKDTTNILTQGKELSKSLGFLYRVPSIPKQKQIEFVKETSFLSGWFGKRRPLTGPEITNLIFNAKRNALGQAVITGFSQVAKSKEVRLFFERGRDISGKHLKVFTSILHEDYLSEAALLLTSEVTDSTEAPFSDRLMMNFIVFLISASIGQYGMAISNSPRRDLGLNYTRLAAEIEKYAEAGTELLIKNGWMEQPPLAANRKDLAK